MEMRIDSKFDVDIDRRPQSSPLMRTAFVFNLW